MVLPPALQTVMERVRDGADWMPERQLHQTLSDELGAEWRAELAEFDETPFAAARVLGRDLPPMSRANAEGVAEVGAARPR